MTHQENEVKFHEKEISGKRCSVQTVRYALRAMKELCHFRITAYTVLLIEFLPLDATIHQFLSLKAHQILT